MGIFQKALIDSIKLLREREREREPAARQRRWLPAFVDSL